MLQSDAWKAEGPLNKQWVLGNARLECKVGKARMVNYHF